MKHFFLLLLLLLAPLITRAGEPCACATDSAGLAKLGLPLQYREMLSTLEKTGEEEMIKRLLDMYALDLKLSAERKQPDSLAIAKLVDYCRKIAGDGSNEFMKQADLLGLLPKGKMPATVANPDFYKARLACAAVRAGQDTAWVAPQTEELSALQEGNTALQKAVRIWQIAGIAMFVLLLAAGVFAFLFWQEKNRTATTFRQYTASFNDLETRYNQLLAEKQNQDSDADMSKITIKPRISPDLTPPDPLASGFFEGTATDSAESFAPAAPPPAPVEPPKIYARLPNGRVLYQVSDRLEPQSTYFVIEVGADQRSGTLKLVEDENTRLHAFSMIDRLRDACELQSTGAPTSAWVDETPGRVELEGGYWNITRKITLQW